MSVREYIGARYVPVFADPIQWDPTTVYEPLTVVTNEGASYVSRKMVPEGILLNNTDYWILWADYNAQLQHYIDEVDAFDGRIDALEADFPIQTASIEDGAITSGKIASGAITADKIASGVLNNLFKNGNIICVTDSWGSEGSNNVTTAWMHLVCNALHANYIDLHQGSTGFVYGTTTYKQRLQNYATANPTMIPNIDAILICGSTNDHAADNTAVRSAIVDCLSYAATTFPNAYIFFVIQPVNDDNNLGGVASDSYNAWAKTARNNFVAVVNNVNPKIVVIDDLTFSLLGNSSAFNADHIHPNQTGHNILAAKFLAAIFGDNLRNRQIALGSGFGNGQYQASKTSTGIASNAVQSSPMMYLDDTLRITRFDSVAATTGVNQHYLYYAIPNIVPVCNQPMIGHGVCFDSDGKFVPMKVTLEVDEKTYTSGEHRQTFVKVDWGNYMTTQVSGALHVLNWWIEIPLKYGI